MKEIKHEVITQGTPNLNNMPKEVFNVFCTSLLAEIEEYYKKHTVENNLTCKSLNLTNADIDNSTKI